MTCPRFSDCAIVGKPGPRTNQLTHRTCLELDLNRPKVVSSIWRECKWDPAAASLMCLAVQASRSRYASTEDIKEGATAAASRIPLASRSQTLCLHRFC